MASFADNELMFDKHTPVLRLNFGKDRSVRWVLWPVLAWRVVAPVPRERKLNVFQRAILGLARAGVVRAEEMAERLLISPDLAALVVQELGEQMGLLDVEGRPNRRGIEWLEEDAEESSTDTHVGHVFTDVFSGKIWSRFLVGDLPIAEVELNDSGWPVLLSGSAGDPWKDRTFTAKPDDRDHLVMVRPDVKDVLRAARRHRRQRRREFDDVLDDAHDVPYLKMVSFIDDAPQAFYFALRARRLDSGDWTVDEPIGRGESLDLRTQLAERLDHHKGLRAWLSPIVGANPESPTLGQLQIEAAWNVEVRLTASIRHHPAVMERLVAMQRALLEAAAPDAPQDKWGDVLVKADIAATWALRASQRPYAETHPPFFEDYDRVPVTSRHPIMEAARVLGVVRRVPPRLLSVTRSQVRDAEKGKGSLRSMLALSMIAARWNEDHPLRSALASHPDLINRLDDLATERNPAAHGVVLASPSRVDRHIAVAYDAVESLLLHR
jgi:hypothetical protein